MNLFLSGETAFDANEPFLGTLKNEIIIKKIY